MKAGARRCQTAEVLWVAGLESTTLSELSWPKTFPIWNIGRGTTEPTAIVKIWDLPSQP